MRLFAYVTKIQVGKKSTKNCQTKYVNVHTIKKILVDVIF